MKPIWIGLTGTALIVGGIAACSSLQHKANDTARAPAEAPMMNACGNAGVAMPTYTTLTGTFPDRPEYRNYVLQISWQDEQKQRPSAVPDISGQPNAQAFMDFLFDPACTDSANKPAISTCEQWLKHSNTYMTVRLKMDGRRQFVSGEAHVKTQPACDWLNQSKFEYDPATSIPLSARLALKSAAADAYIVGGKPPRRMKVTAAGSGGAVAYFFVASAEEELSKHLIASRPTAAPQTRISAPYSPSITVNVCLRGCIGGEPGPDQAWITIAYGAVMIFSGMAQMCQSAHCL